MTNNYRYLEKLQYRTLLLPTSVTVYSRARLAALNSPALFDCVQPRQAPRRTFRTPEARRKNPERVSRHHTRSRSLVDGPPSPTPEEDPEDKFSLVRKSRYFEECDEPVSYPSGVVLLHVPMKAEVSFWTALFIFFFCLPASPPHLLWNQDHPSHGAARGGGDGAGAAAHLQQREGEGLQQLHRRSHLHFINQHKGCKTIFFFIVVTL